MAAWGGEGEEEMWGVRGVSRGGYRQRPLESLERCGLRVDPYGAGQVAGAAARETYVRGSRVRACDRVRVWAFACVCALALAHNSILKLKVTSLSVCSRLASVATSRDGRTAGAACR